MSAIYMIKMLKSPKLFSYIWSNKIHWWNRILQPMCFWKKKLNICIVPIGSSPLKTPQILNIWRNIIKYHFKFLKMCIKDIWKVYQCQCFTKHKNIMASNKVSHLLWRSCQDLVITVWLCLLNIYIIKFLVYMNFFSNIITMWWILRHTLYH